MANLTDMAIGARIRARRRSLKLKQRTIADAIGISCQQVQKYETGANGIAPARLQRIAQILDVSVAFLFGSAEGTNDLEHGPAASEVDLFISCSDCMDLSHAYLKIADQETRRRVVDIVETLANGRSEALADATATNSTREAGNRQPLRSHGATAAS